MTAIATTIADSYQLTPYSVVSITPNQPPGAATITGVAANRLKMNLKEVMRLPSNEMELEVTFGTWKLWSATMGGMQLRHGDKITDASGTDWFVHTAEEEVLWEVSIAWTVVAYTRS